MRGGYKKVTHVDTEVAENGGHIMDPTETWGQATAFPINRGNG
jgi:hypothetical protein